MRLFVAIAMPEPIRDLLAGLMAGLDGARWVDPDHLHLTLRFAGEVDAGTADDLAAALAGLRAPAFDLRLAGFGQFGSGHRVRAVWVGVERTSALELLQGRVEAAVRRAGLPPESRRFTPHVTLARGSGALSEAAVAAWSVPRCPFAAGPFRVDEAVLFESFAGSDGPHYEARLRLPLERLPDADDWDGEWDESAPV